MDPKLMDEVKYLDRVWAFVVRFFLQQSENYQYVVFGAKTEQKGLENFDIYMVLKLIHNLFKVKF